MSNYPEIIKKILTSVLKLEFEQGIESTSFKTTINWDSMTHLSVITGLENEFDIFIDISDVDKLMSYKDILKFLEKHPEI